MELDKTDKTDKVSSESLTGRPKGRKNDKTLQWEKFSEWFLGIGMEKLQKEMQELHGSQYITTMRDLLEYFKPKLARQEHVGEDGGPITFGWAQTVSTPLPPAQPSIIDISTPVSTPLPPSGRVIIEAAPATETLGDAPQSDSANQNLSSKNEGEEVGLTGGDA